MPKQSPVSRYFLVGIAVLMFVAALPDLEVLLRETRHLRNGGGVRTVTTVVTVDGVVVR